MLRLENIYKAYTVGDNVVEALQGVTVEFRKHEFVSVLGPSGCGKTTLLNIIGGLDGYTKGDLVIRGRSTAEYKDSDWDAYRNHSVGFVFQSYNLIPHQSVLSNVELALTLSGVNKKERRRRAKEALEKVGLGDQLHKKPNQMSGGQMQRVAIARALVNDPEIILADEPTGALDSETSLQIMEILKSISKDKLIIMVTHNPELAEEYSSRIIRLLDGKLISDTDPYRSENEAQEKADKKQKKPSMSFFTALSLSFNNLLTKKGRTFMTSFAGSIGIIGIALILSVSQGVQAYIDGVQEDTLASYPITIQAEEVDLSTVLAEVMSTESQNADHPKDKVYSNPALYEMMNALNSAETKTNDLVTFKKYLETENNALAPYLSGVKYTYDINFKIFTKSEEGKIMKSDVIELMTNMLQGSTAAGFSDSAMMQGYQKSMSIWEEMLEGENGEMIDPLVQEQYDLVYGSWPTKYNELVLILDSNNEISDICLYAMGLESEEHMQKVMQSYMNGTEIDATQKSWTYQEICDRTFRLVLNADQYQYNPENGAVTNLSVDETGIQYLYNKGIELKISGILRPNEDTASGMMSGAIGYTGALTRHAANEANGREIIKAQLADPKTDVLSGLPFATGNETELSDQEKQAAFKAYVEGLDEQGKAALYRAIVAAPSPSMMEQMMAQMEGQFDRAAIESQLVATYGEAYAEVLAGLTDEELMQSVIKQRCAENAKQLEDVPNAQLAMMLDAQLAGVFASPEVTEEYYDHYMPPSVSDSSYEEVLKKLGYVDLNSPVSINLYAATFEDKNEISDAIEEYNKGKPEEKQITYTDYVALLMSSVTTVINAISYVLIAFVAISLVVSSIMIGIITYISVLERTKEIGILRSIGASKKDISRVFNAETLIVGFASGAFGILVTLGLNVIINIILQALTGIPNLRAVLPWQGGLVLVGISMLLTYIAGLIPSGVAAKKDPVIALRTE